MLLNVTGKIFERILLNRWIPKFKAMGIPNDFQFADHDKKTVFHAQNINLLRN